MLEEFQGAVIGELRARSVPEQLVEHELGVSEEVRLEMETEECATTVNLDEEKTEKSPVGGNDTPCEVEQVCLVEDAGTSECNVKESYVEELKDTVCGENDDVNLEERKSVEIGADELTNGAPVVVEDLIAELPVDARTNNEEEGNKDGDNDANIAGEGDIVPKKKVKKFKRIVKKRKTMMQKSVVAVGESKSQLLEVHEAVVEARTDEDEESPALVPSDEVKLSRSTIRKKKKRGGKTEESKPEPSEGNKSSGKAKLAYENKNVDHGEEAKSEGKAKMLKKRKRTQGEAAKGNAGELTAEGKDKAESSKNPIFSKKVKGMGMIFMCNSKTKEDCFRHKIMGLPSSKKDTVLSIYKGVRLFLFDFQSRLLYGIYKARGRGGYNIEPEAFNSKFPSQVRFANVKDCSPLPEKKFKEVIKDNYYAKNKFNCHLNPDQVKNLSKLFISSNTKETKPVGKIPRVEARPILEQKNKRRAEDDADQYRKKKRANNDAKREMDRRRANDNGRQPHHTRFPPRTMSSGNPHAVLYEREAYVPPELPALSYVPLPHPVPAAPAYTSSYTYGRASGADVYGQESAIGRQDRGLAYSRPRYLDEGRSDPYPYTSAIGRQDRELAYSRLHYLGDGRSDSYTEPVVYRDPRSDSYTAPVVHRDPRSDLYSEPAVYRDPRSDLYTGPVVHRDPRSALYTEPAVYRDPRSDLYTEPAVYRDPRYYTSARQEYSSSAVSQDEYRPSSSSTSYYRAPLPPHRRY